MLLRYQMRALAHSSLSRITDESWAMDGFVSILWNLLQLVKNELGADILSFLSTLFYWVFFQAVMWVLLKYLLSGDRVDMFLLFLKKKTRKCRGSGEKIEILNWTGCVEYLSSISSQSNVLTLLHCTDLLNHRKHLTPKETAVSPKQQMMLKLLFIF